MAHLADGDTPEEDDDDKLPKSSFENIVNKEKLMNGVESAKDFITWGWGGVRKGVEDVRQSETVGKIKEAVAPLMEKTVDACSQAGKSISEATDKSLEEGGTLRAIKDTTGSAVEVVKQQSVRAFDFTREQSMKGVTNIKKMTGLAPEGEDDDEDGRDGGGKKPPGGPMTV